MPSNMRKLKNGAIYNMDTHRIASGKDITTKITPARTIEMQSARIARKREVMRAAANAAVERDDYRLGYGDEAYIAAITDTAMLKATTADDPKAIEAAKFILDNTGVAEARQAQHQDSSVPASVASDMLALMRDVLAARGVVIDADSVDA